jgi:hypothetical protein
MTALLAEPADAITQVAHDLGVTAETLGWTRPGWIEAVTQFSLDGASPRPPTRQAALPPASPVTTPAQASAAPALSLQVPPRPRRAVECPHLSLSDALQARLVWFAVETQRPLDEALGRLLDFYLQWRADEHDPLDTLATILELGRKLDVAEVDVATLHAYLRAQAALAEHHCTFEDVPEALRLIDWLDRLPGEPWGWAEAHAYVEALAALFRAGLGPEEIDTVLTRHQRLAALGFDEATAEGVAAALADAGATGPRSEAVLRELVAQAGRAVDRTALEAALAERQADLAALDTTRDRLHRRVQGLTTQLRRLHDQEASAQARLAAQHADGNIWIVGRTVAAFLTGQSPEAATIVAGFRQYVHARQAGRSAEAPELARWAATLLDQLGAWLGELLRLLEDGAPDDGPRRPPTGA